MKRALSLKRNIDLTWLQIILSGIDLTLFLSASHHQKIQLHFRLQRTQSSAFKVSNFGPRIVDPLCISTDSLANIGDRWPSNNSNNVQDWHTWRTWWRWWAMQQHWRNNFKKKKYFKKTYFITFQFLIITLQPETLPPIFHKIKTLPEEQKKKKKEWKFRQNAGAWISFHNLRSPKNVNY